MNLFEHNLTSLRKNPQHQITSINQDDLNIRYVGTDNGEDFFLGANSEIYLIKDEIDFANLPNPKKRELIIVMGLYCANELKAVIENSNDNSIIIVVEPNYDMFIHSLSLKDLTFLNQKNVFLFAKPISELFAFLEKLFLSPVFFLARNIRYYGTYFYRHYNVGEFTEVVKVVGGAVKYNFYNFGNSIEDSLIGLKHNMENLKYYTKSKDVSKLKNAFSNVPAIIVSAGPSLDKNIQYLKEAQGKALIIAVDTIVAKLLKNGITPDFMCSIERVEEVYSYFYKDRLIPESVTLVGPLLLYPDIFAEYKGNMVIPLRREVGEYKWLGKILGFDDNSFISMGASCAHLAFGLANHVGAYPIVLVGQDLAYGDSLEKSHSSDTVYDENTFNNQVKVNVSEVPGYFGGTVKTNQFWTSFRKWFEHQIAEQHLFVINATEGGAKIENTVQMSLEEVIRNYCEKSVDASKIIENADMYQLNPNVVKDALLGEIEQLQIIISEAESLKEGLESLRIFSSMDDNRLYSSLETLQKTDILFMKIFNNFLLRHNLQPEIINSAWKLFEIEEELTYENIKKNKDIQIDFLTIAIFVAKKIKEYLLIPVNAL